MAGAERRGEEGERQRRASFLPEKNAEYLLPHYWDERFKEEDDYDWFKKYEDFRHLLLRHVHADNRVLVVGCGNSGLSEDLYRDGVRKITSTDLSSVVVDRMRTRCLTNGCEGIRWEVADMLQLPYQAASYDVVIEKGAMDVLFVDNESPWNPSEAVQQRVQAMLGEVHRVLTDKGLFISVTFGQPHFRRPLFERASFTWSMKYETFGESFHYFFYTLYKGTARQLEPSEVTRAAEETTSAADMEHEDMDHEDYLLRNCFLHDAG